jgi:hypothetical protein
MISPQLQAAVRSKDVWRKKIWKETISIFIIKRKRSRKRKRKKNDEEEEEIKS